MKRLKPIVTTLLLYLLFVTHTHANPSLPSFQDLTLTELEQSLSDIDSELQQLAAFTLRGGMGSLGYRSKIYPEPNHKEWLRIELDKDYLIDQIVLAPMLFRAAENGLRAEGFPIGFRILATTNGSTTEIAAFTTQDKIMPRIAPLAVSFPPTIASSVTIETTLLSPRIWDNQYVLQLSEVFIFSGMDNVALHQKVLTPADRYDPDPARRSQYLVDGFTPYVMDAAHGAQSGTIKVHVHDTHSIPTITIDLKKNYPINQINLHTAGEALSIPTGDFSNWTVPQYVRAWGAKLPDFSDKVLLCEYKQEVVYDNGPIHRRRFPETLCRYIIIELVDHTPIISPKIAPTNHIAFSEIEVLSHGTNIAINAPVQASTNLTFSQEALDDITNGRNYYGDILPTRTWMDQLSRRHDLETIRPLLLEELNHRYEQQKNNLKRMSWLAAFLVFAITISILAGLIIHLRRLTSIKERLAADMHDELGANLHTIGLLSDMAAESYDNPEEQSGYHQRIRKVTERSGEAVRHVADLLESKELFVGLKADMQRAAERIMARLEHNFKIEGENYLQQLKPRTRADLFLFYKESLINIYRHSGATQFTTHLSATAKEVTLKITDNGRGMPDTPPPSLKRRAKLLKAKLSINSPDTGGTTITLNLRTKKRILK